MRHGRFDERLARAGVVLLLTAAAIGPAAADWPQFRGPNSAGLASDGAGPVHFGPGVNEIWRAPVGAGHSSPCINGDSLYVTTYEKERREVAVVCLNRKTGKTRWVRPVAVPELEKGHPSFNPASSSPTCDGERVVAYFGSYGLICFDLQGDKLWDIRMPLTKSFAGNATSPAIIGDRVILYRGNFVDHFLLAVDKHNGNELWRVAQEEPFAAELACTACPIVAGDRLIVHTARSVQAFDIATGKVLWFAKCATTATSTPVLVGNEVLVAAWNKMGEPALRPSFPTFPDLISKHDGDGNGFLNRRELPKVWIFHRPDGAEAPMNGATIRFDRTDHNRDGRIDEQEWAKTITDIDKFRAGYKTHGLLAIPIDSTGQVNADQMRTLATRGIPEVPSPITDGQYVYFIKNGGVLTCLDVTSGERLYQMRTGGRGTHYASPLIAADRLYTIAGNGRITVLSTGPDPEVLASNDMQDGVYATPAIVDGVLYVRTHSTLYAFGRP